MSEYHWGVIHKVRLSNFLGHKQLVARFSPHLNLVIGEEGSGRSSLLIAISIGLGAPPEVTGRINKNLGDLVHRGEEEAKIVIVLANEGREAYRPAKYGATIVIQRVIKKTGESFFSIYSGEDETQKTSQPDTELKNIQNHFLFQPGNPYCLIHEDTFRRVILKHSVGDKYEYFLEATHLKEMEDNLLRAEKELESFSAISRELGSRYDSVLQNSESAQVSELSMCKQLAQMADNVSDVKSFVRRQRERFKSFREITSTRVSNFFVQHAAKAGFKGNLTIDHEERVLRLEVEFPDFSDLEGPTKSHAQLSIAELSFVLVCYVLSIWEATESPIRGIDEFDFPLDLPIKKSLVRLISSVAREKPNRQFFLSTHRGDVEHYDFIREGAGTKFIILQPLKL